MKWAAIAAIVALGLSAAACDPQLTAQSPQPPGRSARLDPVTSWGSVKSYRLELSQGIAIAVTCTDDGPCEHMTASSDNPAIAEVRLASLGVLERNWNGDAQSSSALVVVGKAPGTTTVRVHAKEGHREVAVTVITANRPPGPPRP